MSSNKKIERKMLELEGTKCFYSDTFMDRETFEQISLNESQVKDVLEFLMENTSATIAFNGDEPIEVRIPQHLNIKITDTDPGEKGNTAQGGSKPAVLETGITIQVPLFIQTGDTIRVDTKEKRYIERVKS